MNIGLAIKSVRKSKKISQGNLANLVGISQTALSQIEKGNSSPNPKTLKKICDTLDIPEPVIYILGIDENDVPPERKHMYGLLFPTVQKIVFDILGTDSTKL